MRHLITIILLLTLALKSSAESGVYSLTGLDLPFSAYSVATGEENISSHTDELGLSLKNPALVTPKLSKMAQFSFVNQIAAANSLTAQYMQSIDENQMWSAHYGALLYGTMDENDEYGENLGEFSCVDMSFGGSYSRRLAKNFTAGIGLRFLYSQIADYNAFGFAFDLGTNYYNEEKKISLSLAARNIGVLLGKYTDADDSRDRLPINLAFGLSKGLEHAPFVFHLTYHNINRWDLNYYKSGYTESSVRDEEELKKPIEVKWGDMLFRHMVFGLDFQPNKSFALTASYNFRKNREYMLADTKTGAGWSFGLTVDVRKVKVQAGYSITGRAANTFGVTLGYKLSDGIERVEFETLY